MQPKQSDYTLKIADVEVGGDIHRIILSGIRIPDHLQTAHDVRHFFMHEMDDLRRLLISHPYGNEDMCVDFIFPCRDGTPQYGFVPMECMGYPYFSGSNAIASVAALYEYSLLKMQEGELEILLESPAGVADVQSRIKNGVIDYVTVHTDPAYVITHADRVDVDGVGTVNYALVWSGGYFVLVEARDLGLKIQHDNIPRMKHTARLILEAIARDFTYSHIKYGHIDPPRFLHFVDDFARVGERHYRGKGATYGYPDTIWYCPTGTGTAARMVYMVDNGDIEADSLFESVSHMGNVFYGRGLRQLQAGGYLALETQISAKPYVLATLELHLDFSNPLMKSYESVLDVVEK